MVKKNRLNTGRDYIEAVRAVADDDPTVNLEIKGSYGEVSKDGKYAHIPDTNRTLMKPVRSNLDKVLKAMGILAILILLAYARMHGYI